MQTIILKNNYNLLYYIIIINFFYYINTNREIYFKMLVSINILNELFKSSFYFCK